MRPEAEDHGRDRDVCQDPAELYAMVGDMDGPDGGRIEWAREALRDKQRVRQTTMTDTPGTTDTPAQLANTMGRPLHDARELTQGGRQALIQLDDKIYTLCITRAGKLILTK